MTLSLFACREVTSADGMADVRLGLPIPFVSVDARGRPPATFPRCVRLGDPRRAPVRLRPLAAFADLALLTAALVAVTLAWRRVRSRPS